MFRFNNDYNRGAHPAVLQALAQTNEENYPGYGADQWCEKAQAEIIKQLGGAEAQVHFIVGGTPTNATLISAALRPWQSVISADTGHINAHEAGSIELTGHKVLAVPAENGKLTAGRWRQSAASIWTGARPTTSPSPEWPMSPARRSSARCTPRPSWRRCPPCARNTACTCSWTEPGWAIGLPVRAAT